MHSLLPASTTASRHSTQSKSPSRTSEYDDSQDQDTEDTEESQTHTTTSPPTNKKFRPLSQTRSYHSIFSSVRGSVRNSGSSSRTSISSDKERNEEETPTDTPKEDEATANEAVEDIQPENTNNVPSKTGEEEQPKVSAGAKEPSSILRSSLLKTHSSPPMPKEGHHQSQSLTPRTSVVNAGRLRRPPFSSSRSRNQKGASSSLPNSQDPVVSKKVHTILYPEDKVSTTAAQSSTPSPHETKMKTERESSSLSLSLPLSSAGTSRVSNPTSHASSSGTGPVYPNGRRVTQTKGHRYQTSRQKTALPSSALSQASTGSSTGYQDSRSTSIVDTKHDNKKDHKIKIKNNDDPPASYQYTTTLSPSIKEETTQDLGNKNYKDKAVNSYLPSSQSPSTASPGHSSSLSNRNSRVVVGSSQRKDGRIPWSRTASSVGAGRPILRGMPSNPTATGGHVNGKNKTSPTTYTTKHLDDSNLAKPTVNSRQPVSSNGQTTSNDHTDKEDTNPSNDHKHDYLSEVNKETREISNTNSVPTASPKTVASDDKEVQRSGKTSQNNSPYMTLNRLGLGSNGKVRSALLERLRGRLQTVQNTQLGSAAKQNASSSPVSASSSSSASQTMEHKASPSDHGTDGSQSANVRSTMGSVSRSSLKQTATDQNSGGDTPTDFKTSLTAPARNPVVRSRYPSRPDKNSRGKPPVSLHKPSYGQGKIYFIHRSRSIYT